MNSVFHTVHSRWLRASRMLGMAWLLWVATGCDPMIGNVDGTVGTTRVVSLSVEGTRALHNLGASDRLVAVDAGSAEWGGADLPRVGSLDEALASRPDLVLVPGGTIQTRRHLDVLDDRGVEWMEVAPHDFPEAFSFYRELAHRLDAPELFRSLQARSADPLARLSVASLGERRPMVAPVERIEPLRLYGGHRFASSLIEIAGAESMTHDIEEPTRSVTVDSLRRAQVELVLVFGPEPTGQRARKAVDRLRQAGFRIFFLAVPIDELWLESAVEAARVVAREVETLRNERAAPGA